MTQRSAVNPWTWSLAFGFNQGELVEGANRVLFCAGQTSVDENGAPQHPGDMAGQAALAVDNLEAVVREAGMSLANVVRLNFYTTDVDDYLANGAPVIGARLGAVDVRPAGTLLGVARLAFPDLLLEIEATAVRVTSPAEPRWVDDDRALTELIKLLLDEPAYGLDTEFLSERTYWPQLCLVQVSWPRGVALVDPLGCDVRALVDVLHAPATMITHAGASDLPILERAVGARPTALFDVQLAAGFVGLGLPSLGSLVSVLLGVRLDKSEQLADWSARPLSPAVRRYAAADVEYLFTLTVELDHRLRDLGRQAWAASECDQLRLTADRRSDPETAWWKVKGASGMRGEKAKVAQSVAAWRERRAQRLDLVPRFVLPDLAMAAVVGRPPRTRDDVMKLRGVNRMSSEVARELLEAVEAGRAMPSSELRLPEKLDDGPELEAAVALVVAYVAELARAQRIERQLLATRDDVKALVNGRPSRLDTGWRRDVAGDKLHRLLDGKAVIRLTDGGRHLSLEE